MCFVLFILIVNALKNTYGIVCWRDLRRKLRSRSGDWRILGKCWSFCSKRFKNLSNRSSGDNPLLKKVIHDICMTTRYLRACKPFEKASHQFYTSLVNFSCLTVCPLSGSWKKRGRQIFCRWEFAVYAIGNTEVVQ